MTIAAPRQKLLDSAAFTPPVSMKQMRPQFGLLATCAAAISCKRAYMARSLRFTAGDNAGRLRWDPE